jgi:peptidyl-prolyl cis-trans isomerase A (cyclophilin A)|tara:strand:- start:894 stop:1277 length:384 start_codon:yes stop_codon:yes gene_type:complete
MTSINNGHFIFIDMSKEITTESGLKYTITKHGKGERPVKGNRVRVHYTGKLPNGQLFDTSRKGKAFTFSLGLGEVIEGWEEGIALLRVGDEATFTIPADLAYGDDGAGPLIKARATIIFDVELMGFR